MSIEDPAFRFCPPPFSTMRVICAVVVQTPAPCTIVGAVAADSDAELPVHTPLFTRPLMFVMRKWIRPRAAVIAVVATAHPFAAPAHRRRRRGRALHHGVEYAVVPVSPLN
jgi:hypothetical protein